MACLRIWIHFTQLRGDYSAFLWRISPEKRVERDKDAFLGQAYDLLFPIDWPEPFGLVMSEALACGTPVIAFGHGSVPELIEDGVTGFIVSTVEEAVQAVLRVPTVSRGRCRQVFEARFSVARMAADYLRIYRRLVEKRVSAVAA